MQRAFFYWLLSLMVKLLFYEEKDHGSTPCRVKDMNATTTRILPLHAYNNNAYSSIG